jgi:hypothetical protein
MKVADLAGIDLALWVARALGHKDAFKWTAPPSMLAPHGYDVVYLRPTDSEPFMPHEDWEDGGPVIDKFEVMIGRGHSLLPGGKSEKYATARVLDTVTVFRHESALVAAMRAIVFSAYGPEVPDA